MLFFNKWTYLSFQFGLSLSWLVSFVLKLLFFFWNCFFKDHKISHNHQIWSLSVLSHLDLFQYLIPLNILFFWNILLPELYDIALSWYYSFLLTIPFSSSVVPYLTNPLCSIHLFISIFSPLILSSALTIMFIWMIH